MKHKDAIWRPCCILFFLIAFLLTTGCIYMKMNPPADSDKPLPVPAGDNSCYLHTAANLLAGAGYGNGTMVQARADDIFADLSAQFGIASGGWTDAALTWWLTSSNNVWPTNPYTVVTVYGHKIPKYPWNDPNGAQTIANELRRCTMVGLSISWPTDAAGVIGSGGHAITAWGDHSGNNTSLATNPGRIRVADSDNDNGGDVQSYAYDQFTNPNPGGPDEGNGWYFDYDPNHPYIKHIATLSPTDDPSDNKMTQRVMGSYQIHQTAQREATDLHYRVGTDVNILTYRTLIDWLSEATPSIRESQPRRSLSVDWNLNQKPVPQCKWITITTEFILPYWNGIWYDDVYFTYPGVSGKKLPPLSWEMKTPEISGAERIPDVTGGYVIGHFDIFAQGQTEEPLVRYRFVHQYSYNQSPENHTLILRGERGTYATNFRFGHSYGYPTVSDLWKTQEWMSRENGRLELGSEPVQINIEWRGRLPYPKGEDIQGRIRDAKPRLK